MLKKFLALIIAIMMMLSTAFALASCDDSNKDDGPSGPTYDGDSDYNGGTIID